MLDNILKKFFKGEKTEEDYLGPTPDNYCMNCYADLDKQPGFSPDLLYWTCKSCGHLMVSPEADIYEGERGIMWFCDGCEALLNLQPGFNEDCGTWKCADCGFDNTISEEEIYSTEAEYQTSLKDPYRGISDEAALTLSLYNEEKFINNRSDIILVRNIEDGKLYVQKLLNTYDKSIYEHLKNNPVENMPRIIEVFEGVNKLIVIEEYIAGRTLSELLLEGPLEMKQAVSIARDICCIVKTLHEQSTPIIHRDIKPSNTIVTEDGLVYLLDVNVAKWFKPEEEEDTRLLGTQYYAAPEQLGFGFSASSAKTDIYSIGVLLNVLITGKMPKEEKAPEKVFKIIEKCLSLEPSDRYSDEELIDALNSILGD